MDHVLARVLFIKVFSRPNCLMRYNLTNFTTADKSTVKVKVVSPQLLFKSCNALDKLQTDVRLGSDWTYSGFRPLVLGP